MRSFCGRINERQPTTGGYSAAAGPPNDAPAKVRGRRIKQPYITSSFPNSSLPPIDIGAHLPEATH